MTRADPAPCVVGVFPHPDDESYSAAAALARAAAAGARVVVVCATRGERGTSTFAEDRGDPEALSRRRSAELMASCAAIGAEPPRFLDLPDAGVPEHADRGRAALISILGELGPKVVVTLGVDGVYGHRDHIACTDMVSAAAAQVHAVRRVVHAEFGRDLFAPMCRFFEGKFARYLATGVDCSALGIDDAAADLIAPVGALAETKRASIAAHRSQLMSTEPLEFLFAGLVTDVCERELFRVAGGEPMPPGAADLLDGL